jgi:hypothetical protein
LSTLLSLHPSFSQISSSAPCSQILSVYEPSLMLETKFHAHADHRQNYNLVYSHFYVKQFVMLFSVPSYHFLFLEHSVLIWFLSHPPLLLLIILKLILWGSTSIVNLYNLLQTSGTSLFHLCC